MKGANCFVWMDVHIKGGRMDPIHRKDSLFMIIEKLRF